MARESKADRRERIGTIIQNEISRAENSSDREETARRRAVAAYLTAPRGDEKKNRSTAQSADVRDMIRATLGGLVPMVGTDSVVQFEALSAEDETAAQVESDALNKLIMEDNRGFLVIQTALIDALLLRNGAIKVWQEVHTQVRNADLSDAAEDEQTAYANRMAMQIPGTRVTLKDGIVTATTETRRFRCAAVPIENLLWSSGIGPIAERRFFAEAMDLTRSELIQRGVPRKVVEELGTSTAGKQASRTNRFGEDDVQGESEDQEVIGCHEAYLLIDLDGDGISERWRFLVANENQVLEEERVDLIPFALGSVFLNPHRIEGESLADGVMPVQDIKTTLLRQYLDNLGTTNNGKYVYDPARVAEEDILNPIAGGGIRARDPSAVAALAIPDTSSGSLAGLSYMDQRRTESGGSSLALMQPDRQLMAETAMGTSKQFGALEQITQLMGLNLGETLLRELYSMFHAFLRSYAAQPIAVKIQGQFVQVDPRTWPERTRLNVTIGKTPGQRQLMQQTLMQHQAMQAQALAAGLDGVLVDAATLAATTKQILRLGGVDNPDAHVLDPTSPPAQEAQRLKGEQAEEQNRSQMMLIGEQLKLENRKLDIEERKNSGELAHKYFETETDMAIEEAKMVTGAQVDLEKQRRDAVAAARAAQAGAEATAAEGNRNRAAAARPQ